MNATSEIVNYIMILENGIIKKTKLKIKFQCTIEEVEKAINFLEVFEDSNVCTSEIYGGVYEVHKKNSKDGLKWKKVQEFILSQKGSFKASDICRELLKKKFERDMIFAVIERLAAEGKLIYNRETITYKVKK